MSVKEQLIKILRDQGYDVITACELVSDFIIRLLKMKSGRYKFLIEKIEITIQKKGKIKRRRKNEKD